LAGQKKINNPLRHHLQSDGSFKPNDKMAFYHEEHESGFDGGSPYRMN